MCNAVVLNHERTVYQQDVHMFDELADLQEEHIH